MLVITCPWCGARHEHEFSPGGEAHIARPDPQHATDQVWGEYLFFRTNPKGLHYERWFHTFGCRRWFNVARDTVTHEIKAVYRMGEKPPEGLR
jgi:sarcosine oxidase, subunit delta